jgi:methylenetetrahydrofolate dehydrogenase (NADP+)/methenyltetrahydrofolate cyclohydrolase
LLDINQAQLISPTALGVYELIKEYNIEVKGKNVVVIGAGEIAGKPTAKIMMNLGATVTICNKNTKNLSDFTKEADIIVAAVGLRDLVKKEFVKDGVVMINIGLTKDDEGIHGDFNFEEMKDKSSYITPIIGGTGPMTVALLLRNTLVCYKMK